MGIWRRLQEAAALLAGRWQIPLALCAVIVAGYALYRVQPRQEAASFDSLLADVVALADAGRFHDAINAAANLLEMEPTPSRADLARLHDALADTLHRQELLRSEPIAANVALLLEHHDAAVRLGNEPSARSALRAAQAYEWLGNAQAAVRSYRAVLDRDPSPDQQRDALQALVPLLEGQTEFHAERRRYIEMLLAAENVTPAYLWGALRYAIQDALDRGSPERARMLVETYSERFSRSDLRGYRDYLDAWVGIAQGELERTAPVLDQVAQWLIEHPQTDDAMDRAGFLPALLPLLRGRIHLAEQRPQEALHLFDGAIALQSHGDVLVFATAGRAQALAMLERHAAARAAVRAAIADLTHDTRVLLNARTRLQEKTLQLFDDRHAQSAFEDAVRYLELALELAPELDEERLNLLEWLGRENELAAEFAEDTPQRRLYHAAAGDYFRQAARLTVLDEQRHAALLWDSAQQFDLAGRTEETRRGLLEFVEGRGEDTRTPQALLQLGQVYAIEGDLLESLRWYRVCAQRYPRLTEAVRANLLIADNLIALGAEHFSEAEAILVDLLEGDRVAPQAEVYRDALFLLSDLYYHRGSYADAISRIEDFLEFYPSDPEAHLLRFMLANAYRRSAYALRETNRPNTPLESVRAESRVRFGRAAALFGAYLADLPLPAARDKSAQLFARLSLLYRGDCLYELNEPGTLREALSTYRQAAARYQGEPATLAAQVQIANIYLRQGMVREAASAIERALWLLGNIPDRSFQEYDDGLGRAYWDRYLKTVASSHLFADLRADVQ